MEEAGAHAPKKIIRLTDDLKVGEHAALLFESSADKQKRLFSLCESTLNYSTANKKKSGVLYIAGKQGVKGIRLSLIDTGFDVASYQRNKLFNIVDSEDWYLTPGRVRQFKTTEVLLDQLRSALAETLSADLDYLSVISETDMLVRKGFLSKYMEFDSELDRKVKSGGLNVAFICAFDKFELRAAGVAEPLNYVYDTHTEILE